MLPPHIVDLYRRYCEIVDVVIGHHPHAPQGFEEYEGSKIFYSLGNFIMRKECWKNNSNLGQLISIDINSNSGSCSIDYVNIGEKYISFLNREKQKY